MPNINFFNQSIFEIAHVFGVVESLRPSSPFHLRYRYISGSLPLLKDVGQLGISAADFATGLTMGLKARSVWKLQPFLNAEQPCIQYLRSPSHVIR